MTFYKKTVIVFALLFLFSALAVPISRLCDCNFAAAPIVRASFLDTIKAWVTINPLEVKVASAPREALPERPALIKGRIINQGEKEITNVQVQIFIPEWLTLVRGEWIQELETLAPRRDEVIFWSVKGEKTGNYIITVRASGTLGEETVVNEGSVLVKISERGPQANSTGRTPGQNLLFQFLQTVFNLF